MQRPRVLFPALQSLESEYLSGPSSSGGALPYWWEPALSSEDVVDFNDVMRGLAEHAMLHEGSVDLTGDGDTVGVGQGLGTRRNGAKGPVVHWREDVP